MSDVTNDPTNLQGDPDLDTIKRDPNERKGDEPAEAGKPLDPSGADGPSYERDQGPGDDNTGGSTDPNNTLSHSDSGQPNS